MVHEVGARVVEPYNIVRVDSLELIGYWRDEMDCPSVSSCPGATVVLPTPRDLVDPTWDPTEREDVALHLANGIVVRGMPGKAACRICGEQIGNEEFTDGTFAWPAGLAHYVAAHSVRLPRRFVEHVRRLDAWRERVELRLERWAAETRGETVGEDRTGSDDPEASE